MALPPIWLGAVAIPMGTSRSGWQSPPSGWRRAPSGSGRSDLDGRGALRDGDGAHFDGSERHLDRRDRHLEREGPFRMAGTAIGMAAVALAMATAWKPVDPLTFALFAPLGWSGVGVSAARRGFQWKKVGRNGQKWRKVAKIPPQTVVLRGGGPQPCSAEARRPRSTTKGD
jgi:hypothetical protein